MADKRVYLSSPTMHGEEQKFIKEAFDTNWVAPLGPNVDQFEKKLAAYVGISHAAALSAGTAAIHLALRILGVGPGDVVFAPSLTFSATCNPIVYQNASPVFVDSEPDTWNMCPKALEKAFEKYPHPKAVIVVHLYGTPAKLSEIMEICEKHQVPLIELQNPWEAPTKENIQVLLEGSEFILLTEIKLLPHPAAACWSPKRKRSQRKQPSWQRRPGILPDIISILKSDIITV